MNKKPPIIDLHCDLLSYLRNVSDSGPLDAGEMGCSIPALKAGNVHLQVMAIFTSTEKGSTESALQQSSIFKDLLPHYGSHLTLVKDLDDLTKISGSPKIGITAAIENASGMCEEDGPLTHAFERLEQIVKNTQRVLYISLTHNLENRFGGGNFSNVGLKEDGKALLDYLSGRKIAVDFSHTSDALAYDILDYIAGHNLDIPVMASHSNYRKIFDHPRNLPTEIALEIIRKKGLIGINFLRAFLHDNDPNAIYDHIHYGMEIGGANAICFGADYFHTGSHPDPSRKPFYFQEHENAGCYPSILEGILKQTSPEIVNDIGSKNAIDYLRRIWN